MCERVAVMIGGGRVLLLPAVQLPFKIQYLMLCTKLYKNALKTAYQFILFHVMYQLLFKWAELLTERRR